MKHASYSAGSWLASFVLVVLAGCGESDSSSTSQGISGSKAKIIKLDSAIYSLAANELVRVDISDPANPQITDEVSAGRNAETLTTDGEALYIGSPDDVRTYLYDANSGLQFIDDSRRQITGQDPVIVDEAGVYAYSSIVTQERTDSQGSKSGNGALYVYEIDEAKNITELSFYPNVGYVQGLALWEKSLLVCDPVDGIIQFDVTDPLLVEQLNQIAFVLCEDVIHLGNGHFVTVGEEGIYQLVPYEGYNLAAISLFR